MMKKVIFVLTLMFMMSLVTYAEDSGQSFQDFDLVGYGEGGSKAWDLNGETAHIIGSIVNLTNIVANAYGEEQMNLKADRGSLDKNSGNIHLESNVIVTTEKGAKLVTDSLDWDRENDLVSTEDRVVLTKDKMTAIGTGAEAQPSLNIAEMKEDVTVHMKTEPKAENPGRVITVTCDGPLEIDYAMKKAVFNKNVIAIEGDKKLLADKMEMSFTEGDQINEMVCTGHVTIVQGENTTYCEKAVYRAKDQKIILMGRPKLILYSQDGDNSSFFGN